MKRILTTLALLLASAVSAVTLDVLKPGKNYQSLSVSGSASANTSITVSVADRTTAGAWVDHQVDVGGDGRFSTVFASLDPGHEYAVRVDGAELATTVLGRALTDGWVHENAQTYSGGEPGTGEWGGDGESEVQGSRIIIAADVDDESDERVSFTPTNYFGAAVGYWVRADVMFEGEAAAVPDAVGLFGVTLVVDPQDASRAVFYIIDGQTWKRTDAVGELATSYEWEFFVDETNRRVGYYMVVGGSRRYIGTGAIPASAPTRFAAVDFRGYGSVGSLEGDAYDTKLIAAEVHFDGWEDGSLRAGMNFTNLALTGWVSVTNLWETDITGGTLEVKITGSDGTSQTIVTTTWSGFDGIYGITNLVDGLTRGENYTIEVSVKDSSGSGSVIADEGDWRAHGVMGRRGVWYEEDAATVGGLTPATGDWEVGAGITVTALEGGIVQVSSDGTVEGAKAVFTPTNPVPRNGEQCVNTFDVFFDSAMESSGLPDVSGELFGITFLETASGPSLAVVVGGSWSIVDRAVFSPVMGRLYRIDVISGYTQDGPSIEYYVTDASGVMRLVKSGSFRNGSRQYPADITFSGDGRFRSAVGEFFDTTLFMVDFDPLNQPGTNFTAVSVSGKMTITPAWDTDCSNGTVRVTIRNLDGGVVMTKDIEFHGSGSVDISVDGLEPGESYTVSIEVVDTDGPADGDVSEENILIPTGRKYSGKWIDEDSATFAKTRPGTGEWRYRKSPTAEARVVDSPVAGPAVQIESELSSSVTFESTNEVPAVVNSTVREITFEICSEVPGYSLSAPEYAKSRPADLAGVTIARDDLTDGALHFAVYNPEAGGSWQVLYETVAELDRLYTFTVIITYSNPNKTSPSSVAYYLVKAGGKRDLIAYLEPAGAIPTVSDNYRTRLRFAGSGCVRSILGECYDAHLADIGGVEYWTIADAVHEIGTSGRILTPLWLSTYMADITDGWFGVNDPNHWLNLIWPLGYVVEITARGEIRYYLFHLSDYWIDWAVAEDAVSLPSGWEIKSANGLAWLARESTNSWITGEITLAQDVTNLYEHIWTPINGFTGTFDGNNRVLGGLTDKSLGVCSTNALDLSVYGLFGTASNSVFRNVAFEGVSITNSADAVAALLGCAIGDVTLTNVVVRSGEIAGGRFVSGIVGYIGDFSTVDIRGNFNAATVACPDAVLGGVNVAGIANLGLDAGTPGSVVVVSNENRGTIESTINSAIGGGNVAQILAGTEPEALFDPAKVEITGNIGTGDVSRVTSLNHAGHPIGALPVVNLAAEVSRQSDAHDYKHFIEANDSTDVVIDPYRLTPRMTGAFYQDGVTNCAGLINDQITASLPGQTVTVQASCEIWSPIVLDRAVTVDLDGKVLDNVFDTYSIDVTCDDGTAWVKNGTITHPAGKLATRERGDHWDHENLNTFSWNTNYWDRGIFIDGEFVDSLVAFSTVVHPLATIAIPEDSGFSVDTSAGALFYNGQKAFSLAPLGCKVTDNGDGTYIVELDDPVTAPEVNLALAPNGGTSKVVVKGARTDCEYCLQSVETLAESWDKSSDEWISVDNEGDDLEFVIDTSKPSGFYRIKTRKK